MNESISSKLLNKIQIYIINSYIYKLVIYIFEIGKKLLNGSIFFNFFYDLLNRSDKNKKYQSKRLNILDRLLNFFINKLRLIYRNNKSSLTFKLIIFLKNITYSKIASYFLIISNVFYFYLFIKYPNLFIKIFIITIIILNNYILKKLKVFKFSIKEKIVLTIGIILSFTCLYNGLILEIILFILGSAYLLLSFKNSLFSIFTYIATLVFVSDKLALIFLIASIIFILKEIVIKEKFIYKSSIINHILFILLGIFVVSTIFSINPSGSIRDLLLNGLSILLIFFISQRNYEYKEYENILKIVIFIAFFTGVYALYQYFIGVPMKSGWVDPSSGIDIRVFSTFENPNLFAEYLIMILPIIYSLFFIVKSNFEKIILLTITFVLFISLIFTYSRGGWIGCIIGIIVFIFLYKPHYIIGMIFLAIGSLNFLPQRFLKRILSIGSLKDASNYYRMQIWEKSLEIIKDFPLTGVGLGYKSFREISLKYIYEYDPFHAHNTYIELAIEIGLIGLALFILLGLGLFKLTLRSLDMDNKKGLLVLGLFSGLISLMAHGAAEHVLYNPKIILIFWLNIGFINSIYLKMLKRKEI
ncbi:MAG: O-antigen ligase family protein [Bacillota bacterium]